MDSDNLANVGALTTTPVASGGLGELTDEDDDGLLIGNAGLPVVNASLANIQPIISCSGMHSNVPLFAHANCAHALDVHTTNLPVCTTLNGVLIADPSAVGTSGATANYYNQDEINDINIPIPTNATNQQTNNASTNTTANKASDADEHGRQNVNFSNQVKKQVQFQNVHHPTHAPYIAQFQPSTASPATFVLPVSMATPHLGDIYCHGTAIAYNTNYSSIDSTTSYNSTSCASCNQMYGNVNPNQCPSLPESLEHAPIYLPNSNINTDLSSTGSSSLKQQQSVESIYIELPTRYHIRSNSTPSEDANLNTVIYNTSTGSSINKHSPLTEEPFSGTEDEQPSVIRKNSNKPEDERQITAILNNRKIRKNKSDGDAKLECTIHTISPRKCRSLDLKEMTKLNELNEDKIVKNTNQANLTAVTARTSRPHTHSTKFKKKHHYHSVDNIISSIGSLPHHSFIQRYHSSTNLKNKHSLSSYLSDLADPNQPQSQLSNSISKLSKAELLKRKHKRKGDKPRKEHHKSDNLIIKNRHKLRELSEEFTSSLNQQRCHPFKQLHRSFTESETSSCFARSTSYSSSERCNQMISDQPVDGDRRVEMANKSFEKQSSKSGSSTNSTDNSVIVCTTERSAVLSRSEHYANKPQQDDTTVQSMDSFEFERTEDDSLDDRRPVNRLDSIQEDLGRSDFELDQLYGQPTNRSTTGNRSTTNFTTKMKSATMYNIASFNEPNEETRFDREQLLITSQTMRRHQSAEQMLKRIIGNLHHLYRKQFKS